MNMEANKIICGDCKWFNWNYKEEWCNYKNKKRIIKNYPKIPIWCPLEKDKNGN